MNTNSPKKLQTRLRLSPLRSKRRFRSRQYPRVFFVVTILLLASFSQSSLGTCDGSIPSHLTYLAVGMADETIGDIRRGNGTITYPQMDAAWTRNNAPNVKYLSDDTLINMSVDYRNELMNRHQCSWTVAEKARLVYLELLKAKRAGYFPNC